VIGKAEKYKAKDQLRLEELSDELLFERVQKSDHGAFNVLYKRYDRRLLAYCYRILKDKDLARDVFQSTMQTIYEKRMSFNGPSFATWMFVIAKNNSIKAAQKSQKHNQRSVSLSDLKEDIANEHDRTEQDIYVLDALRQAMSGLGPDYKEAVELRYFKGYSFEQIADSLSISLSLAKVRVTRAKQKLAAVLAPYIQNES
jgi:RNA polymerase sigma-70 factor (ECF subfamily)